MSQFLKEERDSSILKTPWSGHVSQMRLGILHSSYEEVRDQFLIDMIHRFWTLKGLLDFKILGCETAHEVLLIWSFNSLNDYKQMLNSSIWEGFQKEISRLTRQKKLQIINSIANTYEIIE